MIGIPPYLAFTLGCVFGLLIYGPVKRWFVTLRRALGDQVNRTGEQGARSQRLLVIFTTMHPAPWLLIFGALFALYQLIFGPLPGMWLQVIAGTLVAAATVFFCETRLGRRSRPE